MNNADYPNSTYPTVSIHFDRRLKLVEQIVLASIFIAALIGNALVLMIMLGKRHRRITRMAFFILYLTIADLLVAFFSVLPMLIWKSTTTFFGGDLLCRIVAFLMLTVSYISVYTLVAMAKDRYQAIVHPLSSYNWTPRIGHSHMIGVWCLSLLLASPQLFIFRLDHHPSYATKTCLAKFLGSDRTWELMYIAWTIFGQFLLPVILLLFCYSSVYLIVNRNLSMYCTTDSLKTTTLANLPPVRQTKRVNLSSLECSTDTTITVSDRSPFHYRRILMHPIFYRLRRSSSGSLSNQISAKIARDKPRQFYVTNHFLSRARLKTIKLTFIVVLTYILCSTPFYIGSIIMALHGKFISQKTMNWLMTIFSLLFNLNSCSNPIICLTLSGSLLRVRNDHERRFRSLKKAQAIIPRRSTKNLRVSRPV